MSAAVLPELRLLIEVGQGLRPISPVTRGQSIGHGIGDWVYLEAIQALVYHATAIVATLLLTALTGFVIQRVMHDGPIKRVVSLIDQITAGSLILFFVAELVLYFWHK